MKKMKKFKNWLINFIGIPVYIIVLIICIFIDLFIYFVTLNTYLFGNDYVYCVHKYNRKLDNDNKVYILLKERCFKLSRYLYVYKMVFNVPIYCKSYGYEKKLIFKKILFPTILYLTNLNAKFISRKLVNKLVIIQLVSKKDIIVVSKLKPNIFSNDVLIEIGHTWYDSSYFRILGYLESNE